MFGSLCSVYNSEENSHSVLQLIHSDTSLGRKSIHEEREGEEDTAVLLPKRPNLLKISVAALCFYLQVKMPRKGNI